MAGRENYGSKEAAENKEVKEQQKETELPQHFEEKYKLKKEAQEYEAGDAKEGKYKYETDKQGRIKHCYGELKLSPENDRNNYAQRKAGGEDRHRGEVEGEGKDDGGHLIGRRFGGSKEIDNIIAQDSKLNRGEYKKMEDNWEKNLEDGNTVEVDIRCKYKDVKESTGQRDSERPSDIFVYSKIKDKDGNVVEKKIYHFHNDAEDNTQHRDMKKQEGTK